jgi:hypothetical protein
VVTRRSGIRVPPGAPRISLESSTYSYSQNWRGFDFRSIRSNNDIARIPHWKDERPIRPCHDQSQISVRSMATTISSLISDIRGCLICQILALAALFGQPRQDFQRNHSVFLNRSAFRGSESFTATYQFARDRFTPCTNGLVLLSFLLRILCG